MRYGGKVGLCVISYLSLGAENDLTVSGAHRVTFLSLCVATYLFYHRQPKLCGSSLDFEFTRECMKINKIRPTFQFWTKVEIKMTYLVFVLCYLLSLRI